jgi:hypothetical protein
MPPHNIDALSRQVKTLQRRLRQLADEDELRELLLIIRRPGWTTPAEFTLVASIVRTLDVHARAMTELKSNLLEGSGQVGVALDKAA